MLLCSLVTVLNSIYFYSYPLFSLEGIETHSKYLQTFFYLDKRGIFPEMNFIMHTECNTSLPVWYNFVLEMHHLFLLHFLISEYMSKHALKKKKKNRVSDISSWLSLFFTCVLSLSHISSRSEEHLENE